jgi:hypothetical protein
MHLYLSCFAVGSSFVQCHVANAGLPDFTAQDWLPVTNVNKLIPLALIIFLVDFLESLSISRAIGRKYDYPIYPNREVTALGFSNLVGAMFGGYPSTGSFSRTAVAGSIGAKTTLQCFITGVFSSCLTAWNFVESRIQFWESLVAESRTQFYLDCMVAAMSKRKLYTTPSLLCAPSVTYLKQLVRTTPASGTPW